MILRSVYALVVGILLMSCLAFSAQDDRLRFVASGVVILLALVYRKFGRFRPGDSEGAA